MGAHLAHFAVNADDMERTRLFYEEVFGWSFRPWGPPGFFRIESDGGGTGGVEGVVVGRTGESGGNRVAGALQSRRDLLPDSKTTGFECTFAVDDVDRTARAVTRAGGRLLMGKTTIVGVGDLIWFADPSGNVVGAMTYDPNAA